MVDIHFYSNKKNNRNVFNYKGGKEGNFVNYLLVNTVIFLQSRISREWNIFPNWTSTLYKIRQYEAYWKSEKITHLYLYLIILYYIIVHYIVLHNAV